MIKPACGGWSTHVMVGGHTGQVEHTWWLDVHTMDLGCDGWALGVMAGPPGPGPSCTPLGHH